MTRTLSSLVAMLIALLFSSSLASAQVFRRPVACDACIAGWYYFDNNGAAAGDEDWNCGTSSYDGHRGSDFSLAGGNGAIDGGWDVVAAADGVVESATDGFYDRCTSCPADGASTTCGLGFGFGFGNHVVVNHGSYKVVYAHMRNGSVRVRAGDTVRCGDPIGEIGSSGCTTGAHLHFETRPRGGGYLTAFDPFSGGCSPGASLWSSQGPYRGMPAPTCDGSPPPPTCPSGWYDIWTCNGGERRRCISGVTMTDSCSPGTCESRPVGTDDVCDADADGYATDEGDCNDHAANVRPGGTEVCGNGVDEDCAGGDQACPDGDGDGYGPGTDCDDGNASIHPGATEICGNGVDEDCAGGDLACGGTDADGDGYAQGLDCNDADASVHPGAADVCDDGIDQDCVGGDVACSIPDVDLDGYRMDVDCDDMDADVNPGATDVCGDGVDQDCSGGDRACGGSDAGPRDGGPRADGGPRDGLTGGCGCRVGTRATSARGTGALALPLLLLLLLSLRPLVRRSLARLSLARLSLARLSLACRGLGLHVRRQP